jgi:hypothetical protein
MPFAIARRDAAGKPQFMKVVDGVPGWTSDPAAATHWNERSWAANVIAGQTEVAAQGKPDDPDHVPAVPGFIALSDKAQVIEVKPSAPSAKAGKGRK